MQSEHDASEEPERVADEALWTIPRYFPIVAVIITQTFGLGAWMAAETFRIDSLERDRGDFRSEFAKLEIARESLTLHVAQIDDKLDQVLVLLREAVKIPVPPYLH